MDEDLDVSIEPLADIPVEETSMETAIESLNETEQPISEPELAELQNEAAALEIEPLVEVITEQPYEASALENIINAGASGTVSASPLAQIGGEIIAPPGAEEAVTQGLQAAWNMGVEGSREFMDAAIRQHGESPAVEYNELLIQQAIDNAANPVDEQ